LLNGISDSDIRSCREVLETDNILATPINDVIASVESKEMARNDVLQSDLSTVSLSSVLQQQVRGTPRN